MPNYKLVSAVFVALTVVFGSIAAYDSILGTGAPKTITTGPATVTTTLVSTQEVVSTTTSVQTVTSPVGQCGALESVPVGGPVQYNATKTTFPVLVMPSLNSTVCLRLTYVEASPGLNSDYKNAIFDDQAPGIWKESVLYVNGFFCCVQHLKDYADSFSISTFPLSENLTQIPANSTFTIDYFVTPHANATGFYDGFLPMLSPVCLAYPLAVGYQADEVNASDFGGSEAAPVGCPSSPILVTSLQISAGMGYVDVAFPNVPMQGP